MKKILSFAVVSAVLFGVLSGPTIVNAVSATSSAQQLIAALQEQIAKLKEQITDLNAKLQLMHQQQGEIKETVKEMMQITRNLRVGMSGEDVKKLQEFLATDPEVYPEGLVTGYFGRLTERAMMKFQKKMCVEQVGNVGPKTMAKINELLEEGAGKSGKIPPGLLIAPGIQKKLCATSTPVVPDTVAPIISGVVATGTTATTTQIQWLTDELANSKVWYGMTTPVVAASPTLSAVSANYVLSHNIELSDLTASTTYYYLVVSQDKAGNTATDTEKSFTTLE